MSFITKRHIPRRTFLRAPASRWRCRCSSDGAGEHRAGADRPRSAEAALRRHLLPARHGARATGSRRPRARCRRSCPTSSSRSRSVKDQTVVLSGLWSKSAEPPEGTTGSDHWVAAAFLTGIKPRKTAGSDATVGSADDRSDHRAEDRPGDAAAVAAAGGRGSELELEQLRRGLQLLVHELDLVDRAADAAGRDRCRAPARCRWS